jgi:glucoamylase
MLLYIALATATSLLAADQPPGSPGIPHRWAPALKQAVGTSYEEQGAESPVWFTVAEGIVTEVFYPRVDQAQVGDLQFLITDGRQFFSEQKRDTYSQVRHSDGGAAVKVSGQDRTGAYAFTQTVVTDARLPVVRIRTSFRWNRPGLRVFVLFKPAIGNTGSQNLAHATAEALFASRAPQPRRASADEVHAALVASVPWTATAAGYVGFSDGWQDLSRHFQLTSFHPVAGPGNVALTGELGTENYGGTEFELALGFGTTRAAALAQARASLLESFELAEARYDAGWENYVSRLEPFVRRDAAARRSALVVKMHEDKRSRGAIVASLSKPGIPDSDRSMDGSGGYHLVWPRDLYHAAMGLLAAGDRATPVDVFRYLRATQKPDGSWFQNFWVDGSPYWRGLQLDEVAFPIVLAEQLVRRIGYSLTQGEREMVARAARFIVANGPATQQDRWEEIGGYVPSTIAAEIAALRAAARLLGDVRLDAVAREWSSRLESWTVVPEGPHGRGYYLRVSPSGNPSNVEPIEIANGGGRALAHEILDGGFLELVRLGIRPAADETIRRTLEAYERPEAGIATPYRDGALAYRRYNRDAYGPARVGGYWPLLAGERGHYAIASGDLPRARAQLRLLQSSALPGGMIPEQTVTAVASPGAGVACPLVWAHAEDILLQRSLEDGAVFDTPQSHAAR